MSRWYPRRVRGGTVTGVTNTGQTALPVDHVANVAAAATAWHVADRAYTSSRRALRRAMIAAVNDGATVTEVATAAGVPRVAVYRALSRG